MNATTGRCALSLMICSATGPKSAILIAPNAIIRTRPYMSDSIPANGKSTTVQAKRDADVMLKACGIGGLTTSSIKMAIQI
eukprot:14186074-Ditylum_brightwellii.AAC.1